jgi:hypothetical protein
MLTCYKPLYNFKGARTAPGRAGRWLSLHAPTRPHECGMSAQLPLVLGHAAGGRERVLAPAAFLSPDGHVGADALVVPATGRGRGHRGGRGRRLSCPRDRLLRLLDEALKDTDDAAGPDLEVAIRAWANQDPQAAEMQERVDVRRVRCLRELLAERAPPTRCAPLPSSP